MAPRQGSQQGVKKNPPRKGYSFMSLGSRTKGWDKNHPPKDCPYGIFGKRMQRSIMGFGSLATAFYTSELITEAALNASHGTTPSKGDMRHFHRRLEDHKSRGSTEYKTMRRAVEALFSEFPEMKRDVEQAGQDSKPLISKIRKIMGGAHAARNADASVLRRDIFALSQEDAGKRGWSMPTTINKADRGIKSDSTARFFLPLAERDKYLEAPAVYREQVERNQIKLSLSGTWSAILYDESMVEADNELSGLFRSETLLRCGITILCSPSAGRGWKYPEPGARSFSASQKESNAEINGITEITPEVIAYLSTLVVFAVHDGDTFARNVGGIDLSDVYHDAVGALWMQTEWAVETLDFWNMIFFGDREDEAEEPKVSREERFKELEAQQRKREGLADYNAPQTPSPIPEPRTRDLPPRGDNSIASSKSKNGKKRKITVHDSDDDDDPSESNEDAPPSKRIRRRDESPPTTAQPPAVGAPKAQSPNHVRRYTWEEFCDGMKESIEHAKGAGLEEIGQEFIKIASMDKVEGTQYYNTNRERIKWMRKKAREGFAERLMTPQGPSKTTPEPPALQKKAGKAPKKPQATPKPRKAAKTTQGSAEFMPPPKITRSVARLSRKTISEHEEVDPISDIEEDPTPTKKAAGRDKGSSSQRR